MVAQEEDRAVIVDAGILQRLNQTSELMVDLQAHALIDSPKLRPIFLREFIHLNVFADLIQDFGFAAAFFRFNTRCKLCAVNRRIVRLFHRVRNMGIGKSKEQAHRAIGHRVKDPLNRSIDNCVVTIVVHAVLIDTELPLEVGIIVFVSLFSADVSFDRSRGTLPSFAIENLIGVRFHPAWILTGQEVVAGVHPNVVAIRHQFAEERFFLRMKQVLHRPVTAYVRIKTGKEAAAARNAYRVLAVGSRERHRIMSGEIVQIFGLDCLIAQMAHDVCPHFIGIEDDNVRFFCHVLNLSLTKQ